MNGLAQGDGIKNGDMNPAVSTPKKSFHAPLTAMGCVILLIMSPWVIYLINYEIDNNPDINVELKHYTQEVIDNIKNLIVLNATELIRSNSNYNSRIQELQDILNDNIAKILAKNYQPYLIPEHEIEITVDEVNIELNPMFKNTIDLERYPKKSAVDQNKLDIFTPGAYYYTSVPFSYLVDGEIYLVARQLKEDNSKDNKWETEERKIYFEENLPIPHLFIEFKLQQFQDQMNTGFSDVSRMMNYMLTTLARMRVLNEGVFGNDKTHKNILNEGDVELCLNLALLLEEALLFRGYDREVANSIDLYYYDAIEAPQGTNPTGKRKWGSAEIINYNEYVSRRFLVNAQESRLLINLIDTYVSSGYIDPADLLALYLALDLETMPAIINSPKDTVAILQERYDTQYLMDPRTPGDAGDTSNLKFILSLYSEHDKGFNFTVPQAIPSGGQQVELLVDQQPKYLIQDADFKITGLDEPRGWYTSAGLREGTRTASVVPERPKDHDYRLDWEINIKGKFNLNLKSKTEINSPWTNNFWQKKTINFNLPVNIYVWFNLDPKIGSLDFDDYNAGQTIGDKWVITSESHLVEYFESILWKHLKPIFSLGFDGGYSILTYILANRGLAYFYENEKSYLDKIMTPGNSLNSNWICDILQFQVRGLNQIINQDLDSLWIKFNVFMADYFLDYLDQYDEEYDFFNFSTKPQFPFPPLVSRISVLGYDISLLYNIQTNVLHITINLPSGYITLQIEGYNTTKEQLRMILKVDFNIPGAINFTTTVASDDRSTISTPGSSKPSIFADGTLYDKYEFSTRTYFEPSSLLGTSTEAGETNEHFLFTRAKFGKSLPGVTIELPTLSISSNMRDVSIAIAIVLSEKDKNKITGLENKLDGIASSIELYNYIDTPEDEFITGRAFISQLFNQISKELLEWFETHETQTSTPQFAIDISALTPEFKDYTNLTIFLTEPISTKSFIKWFGENGLDLILTLENPETVITELAYVLTRETPYFTIADLEKLDFEVYNRVLNHEMLNYMDIDENIRYLYNLPSNESQNLTLLIALSGKAIIGLVNGINIKGDGFLTSAIENNGDTQTGSFTISQVFYLYQPVFDDKITTYLLLGTTWFIES